MNDRAHDQDEGRGTGWGLPLGLLLLGLVLLFAGARIQPPAPLGEDAPETEFSAVRARALLAELYGDGRPHPTGSEANARVRDRVLAAFERLGYQPEVQRGVACHEGFRSCGVVENVLARLPGSDPGGLILLAAHYDSVAAGPGAGDDLAGVAALLEVARILKAGPEARNSVLFLIEDGEEAGLLGAQVFAAQHPLAREVDVVLNFEARGSSGPSLMFETSRDNAWLVDAFAGAAPRPITSSVFATIYDQLPNDTDFTIFKRAGMQGLNFAFIGEPTRYHSAADTLENLSLGSLQHHGDNALATVRALAGLDLAAPRPGAAVFFDVLGFAVIRWPAAWTLPLAVLALLLLVAVAVLAVRRRVLAGGAPAWGLVAGLLMLLAAGVAGFLLQLALRALGAPGAPWPAEPLPLVAAFWLAGLAAALAVAALFARRGFAGLWMGVWTFWALLGLVTALLLPGISFLFLVPVLAAGLAGLLSGLRPGSGRLIAALVPLLVAAVLWLPLLRLVYTGMGAEILAVIGALVGLVATGLAPLSAESSRGLRRALPAIAAVLALVLAGWALTRPVFSAASPRLLNVFFHQDADSGRARLVIPSRRPVPEPMRQAAPFAAEQEPFFPWSGDFRVAAAPAPAIAAPPPELAVTESAVEGGKRHVRARLVSRRGAPSVGLVIPAAGVESIVIGGVEVPARGGEGFLEYTFVGGPPEGVEIDLVLAASAPPEAYVMDISSGLPPSGQPLLAARPAWAVPGQGGDSTVLTRKVSLERSVAAAPETATARP